MKPILHQASLAFTALLFFHGPIITITDSGTTGHLLFGLGLVFICSSLAFQVSRTRSLPWVGGLFTFVAVFMLMIVGTLYLLMDPTDFKVRVQFLASFLLLPLMWVSFSCISTSATTRLAIFRILLLYIGVELAIVLVQLSYFLIGFGLPPNQTYPTMITGSQFNGNNLAAIVVLISIFYNATSLKTSRLEWLLFNLMTITILLIIFSRLAILLYIFDRLRSLSRRKIGHALVVLSLLALSVFIVGNIEYTGNKTIDTSIYKAKSLASIADIGFETDRSTFSRSQSYAHFLEQLGRLGIGSAVIFDYSRFTSSAVFPDRALYVNPHSMLIEFGYWMGWPGLGALGVFLLAAFTRSNQGSLMQRGFLLIAVLLATSIPSSAIPLPSLWAGLILIAMIGVYRQSPPKFQRHLLTECSPIKSTEK